MPDIADRLKEARERLGLSQQALAEHCGITARSQRNYESGERLPDAAYLAQLVGLGVDLCYVLTGLHDPAVPALDAAEQVLLDSYRRCKPDGRQHLIQTAALLSAGLPPAPAATAAPDPGSMVMSNMGNGNVQVGAGGVARVKRSK
ncbi:helix-turn-helix domain-containing protein [Comamonas aquatica]|uniref:helix-turn-helix domain-containing protein n=1 Tax=Comamonas aquatica TaxID=225991 RepID=UPI0034D48FAB